VLPSQVSNSATPAQNCPKMPDVASAPVHACTLCERVFRFLDWRGRTPLSMPQEKPNSGLERNQ
jgi:hypothetical protein